MAKRRRNIETLEMEINMTPMIDIVFQLLIFFVMQAKFIEFEGELRSYLPKNRGLNPTEAPPVIDLANVTIFLDWVDDGDKGRCEAITAGYKPPGGGADQRQYKFPSVTGDAFKQNRRKEVDYPYPDFNEIKEYIRYRKETYSGIGFGLPVTINFTDKVPMQMIVNLIDICTEAGIQDFAINATAVD